MPPVELYRKHRPSSFNQVIGQSDAIKMLTDMGKRKAIPSCLLFTGPSGVGKTTLARILRQKLKCSDGDYAELNAAEARGIDTVRDIQRRMPLAPSGGNCRIWCIDECHRLTADAQSALLKMLEDTPDHVYFFLATTDPQKLLGTIRTRSTEIGLKALSPKGITELVTSVAAEEEVELTEEVHDRIVEAADGSARKALVILHSILTLESEDEQLEAIEKGDHRAAGIDICRALLTGSKWSVVAKHLNGIEGLNEQAEGIRRQVLGFMASVALKNPKQAARAVEIIDIFQDNFFDSGRAGLVAACFEAVAG